MIILLRGGVIMIFVYVFLSMIILYISFSNINPFKFKRRDNLIAFTTLLLTAYIASLISESLVILVSAITLIIFTYIKSKKIISSIAIPLLAILIFVIADIIIAFLDFSGRNERGSIKYFLMFLLATIITYVISKIIGNLIIKKCVFHLKI